MLASLVCLKAAFGLLQDEAAVLQPQIRPSICSLSTPSQALYQNVPDGNVAANAPTTTSPVPDLTSVELQSH